MFLCAIAPIGNAADTDPDGRRFEPSDNALVDVQQAVLLAGENDKRALVVLGANWCHDSRALAARLNRSPLAEVIDDNYETVFVDVGFLDAGRDVTREYGVANFYATPTVLIVDPATGELIENEERHIWGNAYNISMQDSVAFFEKWASEDAAPDAGEESAELQRLYAEIDAFELDQADRVAAGYAVVGPMLEAYKEGNAPDNFDDSWNELRDFRMAIPGDMAALRAEARDRTAAGEQNIQLTYPTYPPLTWE